jgi:competence CoiA-like predicted nuclease
MIVNQINMGNKKISHFCHISLQYADKCYFHLFNLSDLHIWGSPLKLSSSLYFKQIIVNQINMGNMKISHFYHISLQYANKCHFDLSNLSDLHIRGNISPLKLSRSFYIKQIIVNQINMGNIFSIWD